MVVSSGVSYPVSVSPSLKEIDWPPSKSGHEMSLHDMSWCHKLFGKELQALSVTLGLQKYGIMSVKDSPE